MGCGASKVTVAPEVAKASPGGESSAPISSESSYSSPSKNGSLSNEEKGETHGKIQQGIVSHCSEEAGEPCVVLEGSNGPKYRRYENRVLGEGSFSVVREGEVIGTNEAVAVKCVREDKLSARDRDALQDEIRIMHKLQEHPHVVQLREAIRVDDGASGQTLLYLVMEKVQGGELFDRIVQLEAYTELQARQTSVVLLDAMRFLHAQGIAHRDLKPENLLLVSNKNHTNIKIADFGFAAEIGIDPCTGKLGDTLTTTCGTPGEVHFQETYCTRIIMPLIRLLICIYLCIVIFRASTMIDRLRSSGGYHCSKDRWLWPRLRHVERWCDCICATWRVCAIRRSGPRGTIQSDCRR